MAKGKTKKEYKKPELKIYGKAAKITLGAGDSHTDDSKRVHK